MADTDDDHDKSPIDAALDLFVFAPLGAALTARENLPELVAKGRKQFDAQVTLARMMGQYAVKEGRKDATRRLHDITETLSGLGLIPTTPPPAPASGHERVPERAPVAESPVVEPTVNGKAAGPAPSSEGLAIPGYDTLSASHVVPRLAGLSAEELEAVRAYEAATRGRRTILSKIGQLQAGPAPS
ncbi:MAG: hypothetical protein QOF60_1832 [Actinomycetota bacterium]|jgi:hypothetical protein|nr:hypothetical protein [Actinomycetota bacterium]